MKTSTIYLGDTSLKKNDASIKGEFVEIQDELFYKISNVNLMPDFFMTIVSDSDHWMFISSNGSLSAGRKDRDNALFPYYSDDKIRDYGGITGSKSLLLVERDQKTYLWEPFSEQMALLYNTERNLYKNQYGNKIIFEEINHDLGLNFQYSWSNSDRFGFVKKSSIRNLSSTSLRVRLMDGISNILPSGVDYNFQNEFSNLLDGYKKNELLTDTDLGLFMLSSIPVDQAEPSESLFATTVWSAGLSPQEILLSGRQLNRFKQGLPICTEKDVRATRGAYFVYCTLDLTASECKDWIIVAEVNQDSAKVVNLHHLLKMEKNLIDLVAKDIQYGTNNLKKIVAAADGLQISRDGLSVARHFSNTLFNVMRGGIYLNDYWVDAADFRDFVVQTNRQVYSKFEDLLNQLPPQSLNTDIINLAEQTGSADFTRIGYEYMPLTFSRRHGDPSRPWNRFSIDNRNEDGSPKSDYQGNWRDIFQNWEALSLSFPGFIENMICKFVNASTPDGYNPYRIMRNGIDWECPDPKDPWAYIGYWGDHQIIYLQKLLELSQQYHPDKLVSLLNLDIFAYANVPYRIKPYHDLIKDPKNSITFDHSLNDDIRELVKKIGADGRLLMDENNQVYHVNLVEKILVTLLVKLSNFIPEAGIWMNTQRPEWNDANNALVGNGASMVTLYYLRRFLKFWEDRFREVDQEAFLISEEVKTFFDAMAQIFSENLKKVNKGFSDEERRHFTDLLGSTGSDYRNKVYSHSFPGKKVALKTSALVAFIGDALMCVNQTIRVNKRPDGLYHAYNLIAFTETGVKIRHLYEMLEGQVAVLSSGYLNASESLDVLDKLKKSPLFRSDQFSYILYPDRELPRFTEKNNLPEHHVKGSKLLSKLISDKDTSILNRDQKGHYHFHGSFRNAAVLEQALTALNQEVYGELVRKELNSILAIYEEMFDHQSFTGRSGTFYAYEGLGSIYWHMVSKLLLATEECFFKAFDEGSDPKMIKKLRDHYVEIKEGIGLHKSPELYGAFPTDPYSHTPGNAGAKQPGMTGQVKEDFITRMGELGVRVSQGRILFEPVLLDQEEYLDKEISFEYYSIGGQASHLILGNGQLAFTLCQVPVVYTLANELKITVFLTNGKQKVFQDNALDLETSSMIFSRSGAVAHVEVSLLK